MTPEVLMSQKFDWPITITALTHERYGMEGFCQVST